MQFALRYSFSRKETMRRIALLTLLLCLLVAASSLAQEQLTDKVDRVFAEWNATSSPGCALAVIKDGHIVYEHAYGMANLELSVAITPQSVFDIGSVSKQITATSILLLQQDGKLSLDDDMRKYLPEIPDYGSKITIRHLLHHTVGFVITMICLTLRAYRKPTLLRIGMRWN